MSTDVEVDDEAVEAAESHRHILHRPKLGFRFWVAAGWLGLIIVLALIADYLPIDAPDRINRGARALDGPSLEHPFGLDNNRFDIFSRTIYGARVSLLMGFGTVVVGFLVGGSLGLIAGYYRGRVDAILARIADAFLAFPQLITALTVITILGTTMINVLAVLSVLAIPSLFRITRAATLTVSEREFITAARSIGATDRRIIIREVFPNVIPPMVSFALLAVAIVIVAEGALSFIGLSVKLPTESWGGLIAKGRDDLKDAAHVSMFPAAVMFITLMALNTIGDRLSRMFDVRQSSL